MSSIRSTKEAILTEVDLAWLVNRIRAFPEAYKSTKSKHEDTLLQLLNTTDEIVIKFNEANKKANNYEEVLKVRNTAFVSLTAMLENQFEDFIKTRIQKKKPTDYEKISQEKGHNFHKIVAVTLAAIYNDYPDVKSQFRSSADSTTVSRERVQTIYSPAFYAEQEIYNLPSSPRKEKNPAANPATDKEKWENRLAGAQMHHKHLEQTQIEAAKKQQSQADSIQGSTRELAGLLLSFLAKEAKYFADKAAEENKKAAKDIRASYVKEKSDKAFLLNTLIREIAPDGIATLDTLNKGINSALTEDKYKPLLAAGGWAGTFGKDSGMLKSMRSCQDAVTALLQNKADISTLKLTPSGGKSRGE